MGKYRHDSGSDDENTVEKTYTKGPWTQAEDDLLIAYVNEHGEGNWNAVQKHSGLSRCGKSCRLRWVNHLRPDLKKGSFTEKEEKRVIQLHAIMGNKWARMAAELPGRTDNEIKNFWNTRVKRLQRYGLPVYPEDIREKAMNAAAQLGLTTDSLDVHHSKESLEADSVEIPELDFEHLPLNQSSSYFQSMLQNVPTTSGFMNPCFVQPNMYNLIAPPNMPSRKRPREPETAFPFTGEYAMNDQSPPLWNYPYAVSTTDQLADNHLLGNTTYSSPSGPLIRGVEKLELPSFQFFYSHKEPGNVMPPLESENTLVRSPHTDQTLSDCISSGYDGLLESVVYGSSRQREATDTDSDSILFQCSLLGHTELTQTSANTLGSTSSNERQTSFGGDYIKLLIGEDRDNTNSSIEIFASYDFDDNAKALRRRYHEGLDDNMLSHEESQTCL